MKIPIYPGQTSVNIDVVAVNSSSTFGGGLTGLDGTTSGMMFAYHRSDGSAAVTLGLSNTGTLGVFNSGCLKVVDATNMPGVLQFSVPNAALPPTPGQSVFILNNTNVTMVPIRVELFSASTSNAFEGVATVVDNATAAKTINIDNATSTRNTNVVSVNSSTSAAQALSNASVNNLGALYVALAPLQQAVTFASLTVTGAFSMATFSATNFVVTNGTWGRFDVTSPLRFNGGTMGISGAGLLTINGTTLIAGDLLAVNGSASAASALALATNDTNGQLIVASKYVYQSDGKEYFINNATIGSAGTGSSFNLQTVYARVT